MRERSYMRRLLLVYWATLVSGVVVDLALESQLPKPLREFLATQYSEQPGVGFWVAASLGLIAIWLLVSGSIRLARLRAGGSARFASGVVLSTGLGPLLGPVVYHAWAAPLYEASLIVGGILLGWVYLHPLPPPAISGSRSPEVGASLPPALD